MQYETHEDDQLLVPLAKALIELNHLNRAAWIESKMNLVTFVQHGLDALIEKAGGEVASNHMELYCGLTDTTHWTVRLGEQNLAIQITVGNCGFIRAGKLLDEMEDAAPGLGCAFYMMLYGTLNAFCGDVFDYQRADYHREYQLEGISETNGVNSPDELTPEMLAEYDVIDPTRSVPSRLLETVKNFQNGPKKPEALLKAHRNGPQGKWIDQLLSMIKLAKRYNKIRGDQLDDPPLPSFLVAFKDNDDILAAFDEYAQTALEGDADVVYLKAFDVRDSKAVKTALASLELVTELYARSCKLAEEINEVTK